MQGWIKLHRQLLDWEWYDDINTTRLFVHLLLVANHDDKNWRGIEIKRGQRLTSLDKLSKETGLSVSQIRTCLKKLKSTSELTSKSHSQHTVFTIENYDSYQGSDKPDDKPVTYESQASDKPVTTNKNDKKENNEKNNDRFDFEAVMVAWNNACSVSNTPSRKSKVVTEKTKKQLPTCYKKYEKLCKSRGKAPADKIKWCAGYFGAVLDWGESFVGRSGDHSGWKMNLEHSSKIDTYDKVLEWNESD